MSIASIPKLGEPCRVDDEQSSAGAPHSLLHTFALVLIILWSCARPVFAAADKKNDVAGFQPIRGFVDLSAINSPTFRGVSLGTDGGSEIGAEITARGLTLGGSYADGDSHSLIGFASYTYSLETVFLSTGGSVVKYPFDSRNFEGFVEATGREEHLRFTPSIFLAIAEGGQKYGEVRVSKDFRLATLVVSPHAEVAFTNRDTTSFRYSHSRIGIDVLCKLTMDLHLSGYLAITSRESNVSERDPEDDEIIEAGITATFNF